MESNNVPIAVSASQFNIRVESSNATGRISLRVVDVQGSTLDVRNNLSGGQTIFIGGGYRPGICFVEMVQGNQRKQAELLKIVN